MAVLGGAPALGQDAFPFSVERPDPWKPTWELTLRGDELNVPGEASEGFRRAGIQLRLQWRWDQGPLRFQAGTRSALGSDSNRDNPARWDQQPSNGSELDVAKAEASWVTPRTFGTLGLGLQGNGMMVSQALWDRDLRFLGAGGQAGLRSTGGWLQEAGLRAVVGRVRTIQDGKVDLAAGQLLLKVDTGPFSWMAHADRWNLSWDAGDERLRALPGHRGEPRQRMALNSAGAAGTWHASLPLEARWFGSRNPETSETSDEFQILVGSRERVYWPELAFSWQRLSSTGCLYPLNGDEWWFYRKARGPRLDLSLPLPGQWVATLTALRQRTDGSDYVVTRTLLVLIKRF